VFAGEQVAEQATAAAVMVTPPLLSSGPKARRPLTLSFHDASLLSSLLDVMLSNRSSFKPLMPSRPKDLLLSTSSPPPPPRLSGATTKAGGSNVVGEDSCAPVVWPSKPASACPLGLAKALRASGGDSQLEAEPIDRRRTWRMFARSSSSVANTSEYLWMRNRKVSQQTRGG
jgi:hypothetical protein